MAGDFQWIGVKRRMVRRGEQTFQWKMKIQFGLWWWMMMENDWKVKDDGRWRMTEDDGWLNTVDGWWWIMGSWWMMDDGEMNKRSLFLVCVFDSDQLHLPPSLIAWILLLGETRRLVLLRWSTPDLKHEILYDFINEYSITYNKNCKAYQSIYICNELIWARLIHKHQLISACICISIQQIASCSLSHSNNNLSRGQGGAVALGHSPGESRLTYVPFNSIGVAGTILYAHIIILYII